MDAVVPRVDDQLDPMVAQKIPHRGIALFGGNKTLLRQLAERYASFPRERGGAARRPVGHDRHHVESLLHEVAQV
jgi:hypothetical protein